MESILTLEERFCARSGKSPCQQECHLSHVLKKRTMTQKEAEELQQTLQSMPIPVSHARAEGADAAVCCCCCCGAIIWILVVISFVIFIILLEAVNSNQPRRFR